MVSKTRGRPLLRTLQVVAVALCLALPAAIAAIAAAQDAVSAPTFLAIVREDGLLLPIAVYSGAGWHNRWPFSYEGDAAVKSLRLPRSLSEIPAAWLPPGTRFPQRWLLQLESGRMFSIQALATARPSEFDTQEFIGVTTNYPVSANGRAGEELGVAISGAGELGRFVQAPTAESGAILSLLEVRLRELQAGAVTEWLKGRDVSAEPVGLPLVALADRDLHTPTSLTKALTPFHGRTYYYFDRAKQYPSNPAEPDSCAVNVSISGIVAVESGRVVMDRLSSHAWAEYCRDRAEWTTPLATVTLPDRLIWVVKIGMEDGYEYALVDPETDATIDFVQP
jgi:hypothetical protein